MHKIVFYIIIAIVVSLAIGYVTTARSQFVFSFAAIAVGFGILVFFNLSPPPSVFDYDVTDIREYEAVLVEKDILIKSGSSEFIVQRKLLVVSGLVKEKVDMAELLEKLDGKTALRIWYFGYEKNRKHVRGLRQKNLHLSIQKGMELDNPRSNAWFGWIFAGPGLLLFLINFLEQCYKSKS